MHVGAAGEHRHAGAPASPAALRQRRGAGHRALWRSRNGSDAAILRHRLARDDVLERPALLTGEDRGVDLLPVLLAAQDQPAAGAAASCARSW